MENKKPTKRKFDEMNRGNMDIDDLNKESSLTNEHESKKKKLDNNNINARKDKISNPNKSNKNFELDSQKNENIYDEDNLDGLNLQFEEFTENVNLDDKIKNDSYPNRPKISTIYYINKNQITVEDLKDGRRIFNNKTELSGYNKTIKQHYIEFRQLLFPNLLLNDEFSDNLQEKWAMESAIFCTFNYDEEFIEPLISKYNIKSLIIKHEENRTGNFQIVEKGPRLTFIHPKIDYSMRWGKFHSKLTIFKFPKFLRVIIPSANLTSGDWYYWGQVIWFQDFPLKNSNRSVSTENIGNTENNNVHKDKTSDFEIYLTKLIDYMLPMNYNNKSWFKNLNINFEDYDFSETCVDLVASTSGRFSGVEKDLFGLGRVSALTKSYSLQRKSFKNSLNRLLVQCSSIGKSLKEKFLSDLCQSFGCFIGHNKISSTSNTPIKVDIFYPTVDYVNSFPLGNQLSGCLFLSKDTFLMNRYKFRKLDTVDNSEKTIFHSKFFIACSHDENAADDPISNLNNNTVLYFGSHNLSMAAWGSFEKKESQVSISNYELGIIFNPIKLRYEEKQQIMNSLLIKLNSGYYSNSDEPFIQEFF